MRRKTTKRIASYLLLLASVLAVIVSSAAPPPRAAVAEPHAAITAPSVADTTPLAANAPMTFAVIGDYGMDDARERAVARLVASWDPDFVITTGDDYYSPAGGTGTGRYDESTGAHYSRWLKDISTTGHRSPVGEASVNAFFPALGNHDYSDATPALRTYLTYFKLPGSGFTNSSGNERYYDFVQGSIHFFVLNSNEEEPAGTDSASAQARWLKAQLAASTSSWNIVYDHHPPYSSDSTHGSNDDMRWPFAAWGADVVISGHSHTYERVMRDGIVYFVNGLGGAARHRFAKPMAGSASRYRAGWGAQRVTVTDTVLEFEFRDVAGEVVDSYRLTAAQPSGG